MKTIILAGAVALSIGTANASCADHPSGRAYYDQHCDILEGNPLPSGVDRHWDPNAPTSPIVKDINGRSVTDVTRWATVVGHYLGGTRRGDQIYAVCVAWTTIPSDGLRHQRCERSDLDTHLFMIPG